MTTDGDDWPALQERSHLPEAQAAIGAAVRAGRVRIAPLGCGRVRIIPLDGGPAAAGAPPSAPTPGRPPRRFAGRGRPAPVLPGGVLAAP